MEFSNDIITRILENEKASIFLCDAELRVTNVGIRLKNSKTCIVPGALLNTVFSGHENELSAARQKLGEGTPYISTNFEYNASYSTLFMLPVVENSRLTQVLCCIGAFDAPVGFSRFPSAAADRYRTPVNNLLNLLAKLAPKFQEQEDYAGLDCLNEAARCCYQILRNSTMFQDYYLLASRTMVFQPKILLLGHFLSELLRSFPYSLNDAGYRFTYQEEAGPPRIICGDERLLLRAVYHLLTNACLYSPKGSAISVTLFSHKDTAFIQIADEGSGIKASELKEVFEPFVIHRDVPFPEEEMGLGLGLPIVKGIAELHGGSILASTLPNGGTRMLLGLPIYKDNSAELSLHSGQRRYTSELFSDFHILFADICKTQLF